MVDYTLLFIVASVVAIIPISIGGAGLRELTFLYGVSLLDGLDEEMGVAIAMLSFAMALALGMTGGVFLKFVKSVRRNI